MLKISRESEINLINILIDQDVISGKDLINIKNKSAEGDKSQIEAVFELNLTDEDKILDLLVKEQSLEIADLANSEITDEIRERLDFELSVINASGYPGYFLIVQDFTTVAREMGVSVGPGRGSAAGSAVAYCLGIPDKV